MEVYRDPPRKVYVHPAEELSVKTEELKSKVAFKGVPVEITNIVDLGEWLKATHDAVDVLTRGGWMEIPSFQDMDSLPTEFVLHVRRKPPPPPPPPRAVPVGPRASGYDGITKKLKMDDDDEEREMLEQLKYMISFAKYAVGNLSFKESSILSVPSPSAVFKKPGEVFLLFMRKSYLSLISCIDAHKGNKKIFSIRGTAGIGKSVFGMLWLLLEAQRGGTVIWHIGGYFYLLDFTNKEQVIVNRLERYIAQNWMHKDYVWLIADGYYGYQFSAPCFVLQVCSFKEENHHELSKTPGCQILFCPVWTLDEILCYVRKCKAQNYESTDEENVKKCFSILGGVARYIFQLEVSTLHGVADTESKAKNLIQAAIENYRGNVQPLLKVLGGTFVEKVSDRLVHCFTTEECSIRRMDFASDYVKKQMFSHLMKKDKLEFRKWLEDYKDDQSVGCMKGGLFETYAHQVLQKGGSFKLQNLEVNGNEEKLVMNSSMERLVFSNPKELKG